MKEKRRFITIVISKCFDCPDYMFDYQDGNPIYYGAHVCWYGMEVGADSHPKILTGCEKIPKSCARLKIDTKTNT